MKSLQTLIVALLLCFSLTVQATEGGSGDPRYAIQNPPAYAMLGDLLIARPLLVVATVIGAGRSSCRCRSPRWVAGLAMRERRWWWRRRKRRSCDAWAAQGRDSSSANDAIAAGRCDRIQWLKPCR